MSSVKSVTVFSERASKRAGFVRRRYSVVYEDNNLVEHTQIIGPDVVPLADDGMAAANRRLTNLKFDEGEAAKTSADVLDATLNPVWATSKQVASYLLRWMMAEKDPKIVIFLEPFIVHLQQNFTANQIANLLDFTIPQVQKLNNRVNAILDAPVVATSVKDLIANFDAEEEVIE